MAVNLCRFCALPSSCLQPIFDLIDREDHFDLLQTATGVKITSDDRMPQKMCLECKHIINTIVMFKKRCGLAQTRLLKLLEDYKETNTDCILEYASHSDTEINFKEEKIKTDSQISPVHYTGCRSRIDNELTIQRDVNISQAHTTKKSAKEFLDLNAPLYKCNVCKKTYRNKGSFWNHVALHTGFEYMCEHCGKLFMNSAGLLRHQQALHGAARPGKLKCPYCDVRARDTERLTEHIRVHTGEKPYACDECGAAFATRESIVQHLTVHTTLRIVQCDKCPSTFRSRRCLNNHRLKTHRAGRFVWQCAECGHVYKTRYNCGRHARTHGHSSKPLRIIAK